jgi:hypothetical protein
VGALDLIRNAFRSPADRRLYEAERAAEVWSSAPAPSPALAAAAAAAPVRTPSIDWTRDQPPSAPTRFAFKPGYSDVTYQQFSAPLAFDGFGLDRILAANTMHRLGTFYESSALMVAVCGFAPVLAALQQAIAPILALPRHVHGGDRGLARLVAGEIEEMLVPRGGLLPSPYFPPQLWGTTAIYLRMMGFGCWQHIDGDMDPETGVRPRYTRIAEPWAIQRTRSPRKTIFYSTQGPVEICNDGKFTLLEDENEGHLTGAVLALGTEAAAGRLTQDARLKWLDYFASPKFALTLPQHVATAGQAGSAFVEAMENVYHPDGRVTLPFGSKLEAIAISGEGAGQFRDAIIDGIIHIFMVLTGSAGTIGSGGPTGGGPYQPKDGGVWEVKHHLVTRPTLVMVRGTNQGIIAPYSDGNYGDQIEASKRAGVWKYPVIEVPVPQPDRDERVECMAKRYKALTDQVMAERAAGGVVDQGRVETLASDFEVKPFTLADQEPRGADIPEYLVEQKVVAPDEVRERLGLPPLPGGMGSMERLAKERAAGGDQAGALAKVDAAETKDTGKVADAAAQDAGEEPAAVARAPAPDHAALDEAAKRLDAALAEIDALPDDPDAYDDGEAEPEGAQAHVGALRIRADKDALGHGSDPKGGSKAKPKGTKDGLGKSKAAGEAREASKDAQAATEAAKASGKHDAARAAHEAAAEQHRAAAKASRKAEYKAAHEKVAAEHEAHAKEHAALHEASKTKPAGPDPSKFSKSETGRSAAKQTERAKLATETAKSAKTVDERVTAHRDALDEHHSAQLLHEKAAERTKNVEARLAHLDQAKIEKRAADQHRAELFKAREERDAERSAKGAAPAAEHGKGAAHEFLFGGSPHGSPVAGLNKSEDFSRQPQAAEFAKRTADVEKKIGNMPENVQGALTKMGVRHEVVGQLGHGPTAQLAGRTTIDGRSWEKVGGVYQHGDGGAYTAIASGFDHGGTALHEIGHSVDYNTSRDAVAHSDKPWFRSIHESASTKGADGKSAIDKWAAEINGPASYFEGTGGNKESGRRELFAQLWCDSYHSAGSRAAVDRHFPGYRDQMAKELHADWKKRGAV